MKLIERENLFDKYFEDNKEEFENFTEQEEHIKLRLDQNILESMKIQDSLANQIKDKVVSPEKEEDSDDEFIELHYPEDQDDMITLKKPK